MKMIRYLRSSNWFSITKFYYQQVDAKQRKLQQLTHVQSLSGATDLRMAPTSAGPNDTTKTALQNLINNRKQGAGAVSGKN